MQERVKPGMTEGEVFGIVHEAVLKAGGEMGMIQIGSCSMLDPDINDQRPRPVERVIGERDIINNELGIFYNGYEAQCGRPVVTGEPTAEYQAMFEIALEGYKRLVPTLYAGKSSDDSIAAMEFILDSASSSTAAFSRACSAPIRATSRRSVSTGCRAPRTVISSMPTAGWFTKPAMSSPCRCISSTRAILAGCFSATSLPSRKTVRVV